MIIIATLWNRKGWSILRYHINIVAKKFNSKPIKHRHLKSFVKFEKKKLKKKNPRSFWQNSNAKGW